MKLKRVLLPIMAGALAFGLAACGDKEKTAKDEPKQDAPEEQKESAESMQTKLTEQQVDKDKVVAVVNEEELTGEIYNIALTSIQGQMQQMGQDPTSKEIAEQVKTQTLDTLVNQTLILQKAKEAKLEASASEIDEQYASIEEQVGGEQEMEKMLKSQGMDKKAIKEQIADSILFEKYLEKVAPVGKVTDKEIKEYYDQVAASSKEAGQEMPPLEEVSQDIQGMIEQQQQQKLLAAHVEELRAAAAIELKI